MCVFAYFVFVVVTIILRMFLNTLINYIYNCVGVILLLFHSFCCSRCGLVDGHTFTILS